VESDHWFAARLTIAVVSIRALAWGATGVVVFAFESLDVSIRAPRGERLDKGQFEPML
jgi:hypothetical protein